MLIDVSISENRNVTKKEAEKILKYKDLITEIQHMWNKKAEVLPVAKGAPGPISKSLRQYLNNIPGKREIKGLQKTAILGIAHALQEVLMEKYKTYFRGEITLHVVQIVKTEQLQHYTP